MKCLKPILLGLLALNACSSEGHECTEMGCLDGVSLVVRTDDGSWSDGAYELKIEAAGTLYTCTLTVPADLPASGSPTELSCDPPFDWYAPYLQQEVTCQERANGNSVSQSCTPIPDHYSLEALVPGTPEEMKVTVSRDGATLLEESIVPSYVESQPNGEGCDPICRTAAVELTVM